MKDDSILSALISFLVPIIFLYGLFLLADFFANGFFAFLYAAVLFISGLMILKAAGVGEKTASVLQIEYTSFFILLLSMAYVAGLLFLVTDLFSL
jgi:hypothetical protein